MSVFAFWTTLPDSASGLNRQGPKGRFFPESFVLHHGLRRNVPRAANGNCVLKKELFRPSKKDLYFRPEFLLKLSLHTLPWWFGHVAVGIDKTGTSGSNGASFACALATHKFPLIGNRSRPGQQKSRLSATSLCPRPESQQDESDVICSSRGRRCARNPSMRRQR